MGLMLGKNVVIIGSMYFMSSGFTKLKFKYLSQEFSENQVLLIKVEYEYMNSFEMFNQTKLPKKEDFYSTLNDKHISDKNYEHVL